MTEKRKRGRPPGSKNKKTIEKESSLNKSRKKSEKNAKGSSTKSSRANTSKMIIGDTPTKEDLIIIDKKRRLHDEIWAIVLIAISVFLIIAFQTTTVGAVGYGLVTFFKGCFGYLAYILPYYILIYAALLFVRGTIHIGARSVILLAVIFVMAVLINSARYINADSFTYEFGASAIAEYFIEGIDLKNGGLVGMYLGGIIAKLIGVVGLYIFSILGVVICLILILNIPISKALEQRSVKKKLIKEMKAAKKVEEDAELAKMIREEEEERRKNRKNMGEVSDLSEIMTIGDDEVSSNDNHYPSGDKFNYNGIETGLSGAESNFNSTKKRAGGAGFDPTGFDRSRNQKQASGVSSDAAGFGVSRNGKHSKGLGLDNTELGMDCDQKRASGAGLDDTRPGMSHGGKYSSSDINDPALEKAKKKKDNILKYFSDESLFGDKSSDPDHKKDTLGVDHTQSNKKNTGINSGKDNDTNIGFYSENNDKNTGLYSDGDINNKDKNKNDSSYSDNYDDEPFNGFIDREKENEKSEKQDRGSAKDKAALPYGMFGAVAGSAGGAAVNAAVSESGVEAENSENAQGDPRNISGSNNKDNNQGNDPGSKSGEQNEYDNYSFPPVELLNKGDDRAESEDVSMMLGTQAAKLEATLASFKVDAKVIDVTRGPAVTRFEIQPGPGVKVSSIVRLADDIALNMEARNLRIEAPIPGKKAVGIEIGNDDVSMVTLRDILDSSEFRKSKSKITFAVGRDISGKSVVADLKKMPHLLIAGATGSGKSVCVNSIISSILYKARPDEVKLILVDPKVVELSNYNGIPHLLVPVVTEPSKAAGALSWACSEMDERYNKFAKEGVRNLEGYNKAIAESDDPEKTKMPQIVIIIDELADLMMEAPRQVEDSICRLTQKARAAGMHLIVATQRPSVDVITGLIKANIPSRIAFMVSSQIDSRTILDMGGAEKLVGNGDMLYYPASGVGKPVRIQGPFISDEEVSDIIDFVKNQSVEAEYSEDVIDTIESSGQVAAPDNEGEELLPDAIELVVTSGHASTSMLQRRFRVGYNRAARMMDMMEERGIIGPADGSRPRQVFMTEQELERLNSGLANNDVAGNHDVVDNPDVARDPDVADNSGDAGNRGEVNNFGNTGSYGIADDPDEADDEVDNIDTFDIEIDTFDVDNVQKTDGFEDIDTAELDEAAKTVDGSVHEANETDTGIILNIDDYVNTGSRSSENRETKFWKTDSFEDKNKTHED